MKNMVLRYGAAFLLLLSSAQAKTDVFIVGANWTSDCGDDGPVFSEEECGEAASSLGLIYKGTNSSSKRPKGCYAGKGWLLFNLHETGGRAPGRAPVCSIGGMTCKENNLPTNEGTKLSNPVRNSRDECIGLCDADPNCNALAWNRLGTNCHLKQGFDFATAVWKTDLDSTLLRPYGFDFCYDDGVWPKKVCPKNYGPTACGRTSSADACRALCLETGGRDGNAAYWKWGSPTAGGNAEKCWCKQPGDFVIEPEAGDFESGPLCAPDCTDKCGGAADGCSGTCDDACPPESEPEGVAKLCKIWGDPHVFQFGGGRVNIVDQGSMFKDFRYYEDDAVAVHARTSAWHLDTDPAEGDCGIPGTNAIVVATDGGENGVVIQRRGDTPSGWEVRLIGETQHLKVSIRRKQIAVVYPGHIKVLVKAFKKWTMRVYIYVNWRGSGTTRGYCDDSNTDEGPLSEVDSYFGESIEKTDKTCEGPGPMENCDEDAAGRMCEDANVAKGGFDACVMDCCMTPSCKLGSGEDCDCNLEEQPKECTLEDGTGINAGETTHVGCNVCTCVEGGELVCGTEVCQRTCKEAVQQEQLCGSGRPVSGYEKVECANDGCNTDVCCEEPRCDTPFLELNADACQYGGVDMPEWVVGNSADECCKQPSDAQEFSVGDSVSVLVNSACDYDGNPAIVIAVDDDGTYTVARDDESYKVAHDVTLSRVYRGLKSSQLSAWVDTSDYYYIADSAPTHGQQATTCVHKSEFAGGYCCGGGACIRPACEGVDSGTYSHYFPETCFDQTNTCGSHPSAEAACAETGATLCSVKELEAGVCASGDFNGCGFRWVPNWTSTPCVPDASLSGVMMQEEGGQDAIKLDGYYYDLEDDNECDQKCSCHYVGAETDVKFQYLCQGDNVCYNLVGGWCDESETVCEIP